MFNEAVSTTNIKIRIVEWRKDVINNVQHERNWQEATVGFQGNYYLRILLDRLRKTQIKLNVLPNQDPNCVEYPGRNCAFCLRHYFAGRRKTKHIHKTKDVTDKTRLWATSFCCWELMFMVRTGNVSLTATPPTTLIPCRLLPEDVRRKESPLLLHLGRH